MPDEPPRDLDGQAPGRWARADDLRPAQQALRGAGRSTPAGWSPLLRTPRDYYAYLEQTRAEHQGWQALGGTLDISLSANRYGFYSRAQELYPQAFKALDTAFWRAISDEEREAQMRRQASAQERVGFERNTQKFFIGDVQVDGLPGPGEEPSATELLTEFDTEYTLRRKAYQQRQREREEIASGKRKRYNRFTAARDEDNCLLLSLPSVIEGVKATPALRSVLPGAQQLSRALEQERAAELTFKQPAADSPGLKRLRDKTRRPPSLRDLPHKTPRAVPPLPAEQPAAHPAGAGNAQPQAQRERGLQGRRYKRQAVQVSTRNKYGLKSRSELDYPQAYEPVASELWTGLTEAERTQNYIAQAIAQEKAGFEKDAPKYFIEDFDPAAANAPDLREQLAPATRGSRRGMSALNAAGLLLLVLTAAAAAFCQYLGLATWPVVAGLVLAGLLGLALLKAPPGPGGP